jgi:phosphoglycerate dehydrogenase-like enzyme
VRRVSALPDINVLTANSNDELRARLPSAEVLITSNRIYEAEAAKIILDLGKKLRWIQFTTSGVDKAVKNGLPAGVPVTNASGFHARRVAEHAMSLLLAVIRRHGETFAARPRQAWVRDEVSPRTTSLERKTLLVIGLGAVGQDIARKAKAFDMRVIGVSRSAAPLPNIDAIYPRGEMLTAIAEADVVALGATYDDTTHHMIGAQAFAAMKPTAVLVNVARGLLVDEAAMIAALRDGRIFGAGLDVTSEEPLPAGSPLWSLPNVVLTPHIAGAGGDNTEAVVKIFADNYARYRRGEPLTKLVHGPAAAPAQL